MRVALFITCFNDTVFPQTGKAVVELLERLGHEVDFPEAQTCCGQMHFNTGYRPEAVPLVRGFVDAFEGYDAIVTPSASCAGMVRENHAVIAGQYGDPALRSAVAEVAPRVHEFTEFLVDVLGVTDVGASFPHRVAYHPTCHSLRGLRLGDRPERLLRAVRGLDLAELPREEACCGFGGTFAVKNPDTSAAMLADKMRSVLDSGAEILCAADNSCLLHIGGGLSRMRTGVRTLHLAEILAATEGSGATGGSTATGGAAR
jgi:L-lactate dehydrogenase complex protein LldE